MICFRNDENDYNITVHKEVLGKVEITVNTINITIKNGYTKNELVFIYKYQQ